MSADPSRHGPADLLTLRSLQFLHGCWYCLIKRPPKVARVTDRLCAGSGYDGLQDEVGSMPRLQIPVREHFAGLVKFIEQRYAGRNVEFQNFFL